MLRRPDEFAGEVRPDGLGQMGLTLRYAAGGRPGHLAGLKDWRSDIATSTSSTRRRFAVVAALIVAAGLAFGLVGLPRLLAAGPAAPGGLSFHRTIQYAGFTIRLGDLASRKLTPLNVPTWEVTVQAEFTNNASLTNDSERPAAKLAYLPTLTIDGDTRRASLASPTIAYGASAQGRFTFTDYPFDPNLDHAVMTFGDQYTQEAVVPISGPGFTSLVPVPVKLTGIADTGPGATVASLQSAELRADIGYDPTKRGVLALFVRFGISVGENYTNGAARGWDASDLVIHAPSGAEIRTEFGATQVKKETPRPRNVAIYRLPQPEAGRYSIVNAYVGYGTRHGGVSFDVPEFGPTFKPFAVISPRSLDGAQGTAEDEGAVDFANLQVGGGASQYITYANGGPGILLLDRVEGSGPFGIRDPGHCPMALTIGQSCQFEVTFSPKLVGHYDLHLSLFDNMSASPHTVSVIGTGTPSGVNPALPALTVDSSMNLTEARAACSGHISGWAAIGGADAELRGQVLTGHVATEDLALNHEAFDYNWFVYPDAGFQHFLAPGNFTTGDEYSFGRLEVEMEAQTAKVAGGIPRWAWPQRGDRVYLTGHHTADCGHGGGGIADAATGGSFTATGERAEIHPPSFIATYRNAALAPFDDSPARTGTWHAGTPATQVDVFASNYGGGALDSLNLGLYRSTSLGSVKFAIYAPPRPSPGATLREVHTDRGNSGAENVTLEPMGNHLGYDATVTQPSPPVPGKPTQTVGSEINVFWSETPRSFAAYAVHHYEVTIDRIEVRSVLKKDWTFFGYVNDQAAPLVQGSVSSLGLPFEEVSNDFDAFCSARGSPSPDPRCVGSDKRARLLHNNAFDVWLVPGQVLRLQVRGRTPSTGPSALGGGLFAGTAGINLGASDVAAAIAAKPGDQVRNLASEDTMFGQREDGEGCSSGCFDVRFGIHPLP